MSYITQDGHEMKEGETMWRVSNASGNWVGEPGSVVFSNNTGYNMVTNVPKGTLGHIPLHNDGSSPFPEGQIHFFNPEKAIKYLEDKRK